jgi:hypothetical protein
MMPSPFSSEGSVTDSEELVMNLGCERRIEPISAAFETLRDQMDLKNPTKGGESLAAENMQSRLRGVILMGDLQFGRTPIAVDGKQERVGGRDIARCTATRTADSPSSAMF